MRDVVSRSYCYLLRLNYYIDSWITNVIIPNTTFTLQQLKNIMFYASAFVFVLFVYRSIIRERSFFLTQNNARRVFFQSKLQNVIVCNRDFCVAQFLSIAPAFKCIVIYNMVMIYCIIYINTIISFDDRTNKLTNYDNP